jgi:hypothetical protein
MGPDLIEFTITLYLQADNEFYYTSESDRGDADLEGDYELDSDGTLILYDTEGVLKGQEYEYDASDGTIEGNWYIGDAPGHVFWPATLTRVPLKSSL